MTVSYIQVHGLEVRVQRRRGMCSVRMHVRADGTPQVTAPFGVPTSELIRIVEDNEDLIAKVKTVYAGTPRAHAEQASAVEREEWRAAVAATVPLLLEKWEPAMGVRAKKLAYRDMTSRWGSCQPSTGRICINTRLALYPPACLEYVVVHELCHLLVAGHEPRFWARMDAFLPTWREAKKQLDA